MRPTSGGVISRYSITAHSEKITLGENCCANQLRAFHSDQGMQRSDRRRGSTSPRSGLVVHRGKCAIRRSSLGVRIASAAAIQASASRSDPAFRWRRIDPRFMDARDRPSGSFRSNPRMEMRLLSRFPAKMEVSPFLSESKIIARRILFLSSLLRWRRTTSSRRGFFLCRARVRLPLHHRRTRPPREQDRRGCAEAVRAVVAAGGCCRTLARRRH
jgi:hypothetical protein